MQLIECSACRVQLRAPDDARAVRCPKCRTVYAVGPAAPPPAASAPVAPAGDAGFEVMGEAPARPRSRDDEAGERPRRRAEPRDDRTERGPRPRRRPDRGGRAGAGAGRKWLLIGGAAVTGLVVLGVGLTLVFQYVSQSLAFGGKWPEPTGAPTGMFAADKMVTLHVLGVEDDATLDAIGEQIEEIRRSGAVTMGSGSMSSWKSPRWTHKFEVDDPQKFARLIKFGTVHSVRDRVINVIANKPERQPPTEPVDRALYYLGGALPHRRREAVDALAKAVPDGRRAAVLKAIEPLLDDPSTRDGAIPVLCTWGTRDDLPLMTRVVKNDMASSRIIEAMGKMKDERTIEPIARALEGFFTRGAAKEALIGYGPAAEGPVLKLLQSKDPSVQAVACEVLGRIGGPASYEPLVQCAATPGYQGRADEALVKLGPATEDFVLRLLTNTDRNVRAKGCEILGKIGTQKSLPALQAALAPAYGVEFDARAALDQIGKRLAERK